MVSRRAVVGIYRGAGSERDCAGRGGGKERRERRERREKRGRREAGGSTDLGDFSGGRRGLAIDAIVDGYRRIWMVERRREECGDSGEPGTKEREKTEAKKQRVLRCRRGISAQTT